MKYLILVAMLAFGVNVFACDSDEARKVVHEYVKEMAKFNGAKTYELGPSFISASGILTAAFSFNNSTINLPSPLLIGFISVDVESCKITADGFGSASEFSVQ